MSMDMQSVNLILYISGIALLIYVSVFALRFYFEENITLRPLFTYPLWAQLLAYTFVLPALLMLCIIGIWLLGSGGICWLVAMLNEALLLMVGLWLIVWSFYLCVTVCLGGRNGTRSPS